ncbi:ABC-three component system middle component 6 [uncultured Microbacterium sp.]|uniref:ABC-three component system middle component 6 n=2 Tax=uncultured Microbacterium sp. TaxID=191216 RepID=UPI003459E853
MSSDRALMTIGAEILDELRDPLSVSALWGRFTVRERSSSRGHRITFDWFTLALAALYAMNLVDTSTDGFIRRTHVS